MLDATVSVRQPLRDALTPLGAKLYTDERFDPGGTVRVPYAWFYSASEGDAPPTLYGYLEDTVSLDLFASSQRQMANLEDAVEFMDDYHADSYGNARFPHYRFQSKTRLFESEGIIHTTILYTCRYFDLRKLVS